MTHIKVILAAAYVVAFAFEAQDTPRIVAGSIVVLRMVASVGYAAFGRSGDEDGGSFIVGVRGAIYSWEIFE